MLTFFARHNSRCINKCFKLSCLLSGVFQIQENNWCKLLQLIRSRRLVNLLVCFVTLRDSMEIKLFCHFIFLSWAMRNRIYDHDFSPFVADIENVYPNYQHVNDSGWWVLFIAQRKFERDFWFPLLLCRDYFKKIFFCHNQYLQDQSKPIFVNHKEA